MPIFSADSGSTGGATNAGSPTDASTAPGMSFDYGMGFLGNENKRTSVGKATATDVLDPTFFDGSTKGTIENNTSSETGANNPQLVKPDEAMGQTWINQVLSVNVGSGKSSGQDSEGLEGSESLFSSSASASTSSTASTASTAGATTSTASTSTASSDEAASAAVSPNLWVSTPSTVYRVFLILAELAPLQQKMISEETQALVKGMQVSLDMSKASAEATVKIGQEQVTEAGLQVGAAAAQIAGAATSIGGSLGGTAFGYNRFQKDKAADAADKPPGSDKTEDFATKNPENSAKAEPSAALSKDMGKATQTDETKIALSASPTAEDKQTTEIQGALTPKADKDPSPPPSNNNENSQNSSTGTADTKKKENKPEHSMYGSQTYRMASEAVSSPMGSLGQAITASGSLAQGVGEMQTKMAIANEEAVKTMAEAAKTSADQSVSSLTSERQETIKAAETMSNLLQTVISTAQARLSQAPSGT